MHWKSNSKSIINWSAFLTVVSLLVVRLSFFPAVLSGSTKLLSVVFDSVGQSLILTIAPRNMFLISLKTDILYSSALWAMFNEASGAVFLKSSHPHLTPASIFLFPLLSYFLIDYLEELPPFSLSFQGYGSKNLAFHFLSAICLLMTYSTNTILAIICRAASPVQNRL